MNINQAKAVAGIPKEESLVSPADFERAIAKLKAMIVCARKAGEAKRLVGEIFDVEESRAAELSEARRLFQLRTLSHDRCQKCGEPVNKGALHCSLCHKAKTRPKALPLPAGFVPPKRAKKSNPPTRTRALHSNWLAECGRWATPVKNVIAKWEDQIGEECCCDYLPACARIVFGDSKEIRVDLASVAHRGYVFDLLTAMHKLWTNKSSPTRWLLALASGGSVDQAGRPIPRSYREINEMIAQRGGKPSTVAALTQEAKRLRLNDKMKA